MSPVQSWTKTWAQLFGTCFLPTCASTPNHQKIWCQYLLRNYINIFIHGAPQKVCFLSLKLWCPCPCSLSGLQLEYWKCAPRNPLIRCSTAILVKADRPHNSSTVIDTDRFLYESSSLLWTDAQIPHLSFGLLQKLHPRVHLLLAFLPSLCCFKIQGEEFRQNHIQVFFQATEIMFMLYVKSTC